MILKSSIFGVSGSPVLIILHGLFGESKNWLSIAKELESVCEIHLIDQRNHGDSFHDTEHNYLVLAADLLHYIKKKQLINYSIIGHSMGGKVAMQFGLLYPDNLNKLIIVDIAPKRYQNHHFKIFEGLKRVIHDAISRKDGIKILMEYVDDIIVVNFLLKGLFFSRDNNPQLKFNIHALENNITNMLSEISSDTTFDGMTYFLRGKQSEYIKDTDFKYISTLFPNHQVFDFSNAGHWIHVDDKEFFLNTIKLILN